MGKIRLSESQLINVIKKVLSEGDLTDWNENVNMEYQMLLSMIKSKVRELDSLKKRADRSKKEMPEIIVSDYDKSEKLSMILRYFNPETEKMELKKFDLGDKNWFDGPDDPAIQDYAESRAFQFLNQNFPKTYYY